MALRLTIISDQAAALGEAATALLGPTGGSIGRARDNDLVLPDSSRYVSAHHARIRQADGGYLVEDTSTNGVYINGSTDPVGKVGAQPIRSGDVLRLGNYHIRVLDEAAPATADASSITPFHHGDNHGGDHGAVAEDLLLEDLLVDDPSVSAERRALDPWGQRIDDSAVLRFDRAQATGNRRAPRSAGPGGSSSTSLPSLRAPPPAPPRRNALDPFCQGAGIAPTALPEGRQDAVLRLAGVLLREALVGLRELARVQQSQRSGLGVAEPDEEAERAELRRLPVDELVACLLSAPSGGPIDPVQWLRELIAQLVRHDAGLLHAVGPALGNFTARLEPGQQGPAEEALERFRSITSHRDGQLPTLFTEALARELAAQLDPATYPALARTRGD